MQPRRGRLPTPPLAPPAPHAPPNPAPAPRSPPHAPFQAHGSEWKDEPPTAHHAFWSLVLHQLVSWCTNKVWA